MSQHSNLLADEKVRLYNGDGWIGMPQFAPFNVIHVGAAAASVPKNLLGQLAVTSYPKYSLPTTSLLNLAS